MVSKLGWQTIASVFDSHWVAHTFGFMPNYTKLSGVMLVVYEQAHHADQLIR